MNGVVIKDLNKSFGLVSVLKNINLTIEAGEFLVLLGPSGCGKSTLLRLIAGLEEEHQGEIYIGDRMVSRLDPKDRRVAMVFQSYALFPHMNVSDNIGFGLKINRVPRDEMKARIATVAEMLQITNLLERRPSELSGGQRQRVAIGRAMVRHPDIFLFDEPLSNLDAALRVQMRMEIQQLKKQLPDTTMIYVTHDQTEAMTMADRIVVMKDGVIQQIGSPMELYDAPQSLFVAGFIGSPRMNLLTGKFAEPYRATTIGVRPEHLAISATGGGWAGRVIYSENLGSDSFAYVDIGSGEPVVARAAGKANFHAGDRVVLTPATESLHRFDTEGKPIRA